jgi:RHS repeat-associated protein
MSIHFKKQIWFFFLLLLGGAQVYATSYSQKDSTWYKHAQLNSSPGDSVLYVKDSVPGASTCNKQILSATFNACFYMGHPYKYGTTIFKTSVNIRVRSYSTFIGSSGLINETFVNLTLNQDSVEQLYLKDLTSNYSSINRIVIHIMSYSGPTTSTLQDSVHLGLYVKRTWGVGVSGVSVTTATATVANPTVFAWKANCKDVPNYQVQVLRLYNTNALDTTETTIDATINWNQAMSIEVGSKDTSLSLTLSEGQGYYIWRVRPIGSYYPGGIADSRNWGSWNISTTGFVTVSSSGSGIFYYTQFDNYLNWIYSRTFSEGDPASPKVRISEKLTYANGLQQVKQTQAHMQSLHQVIVSQTIYDWSGRAALVTLPAPVSRDYMAYQTGFAKANATTLYSQAHFDEDTVYNNPKPMANCFLAGYYSDTIADKFIPNSEGYPFSRALYERDGTARVKEQGGPGSTHRIKTGVSNTTRTYYSGVSDPELIRVLGDEAPLAQSVHKVINIDANNTASVTYMSKEGQAIITCLAIGSDNNAILDTLSSQSSSRFTVHDTIKGNTPYGNYGITSSKPITFAVPTALTIKYDLSAQNVQQLCMSYCKNCDYTVEFLIRGDNYTLKKSHVITAQNCTTPKPRFDTTFTVSLAAGSYVLEKRVYANGYVPGAYSDSTGSQHYVDYHLANLRKMFQDTANAKLATVYTYLKTNNTSGLNTYLGINTSVSNPDSVFADSSKVFNIKCASIKIPILTCTTNSCGASNNPDFEGYFNKIWAGTAYVDTTAGYLNYFPLDTVNGNPGYRKNEFDTVIHKMLLETGSHAYTCANLWDCWKRCVQGYGRLKASADSMKTFKVNLLQEFLSCAGTQYAGYKTQMVDSALWKYRPYKYFYYSKGHKTDCDALVSSTLSYGTEPWAQDTLHGIAPKNSKYHNYHDCVANEKTTLNLSSITSTATAVNNCEAMCDARMGEFIQSLIRMYHNDSIYVEGDVYKLKRDASWGQVYCLDTAKFTGPYSGSNYKTLAMIQCAARSLVDNAKKSCVLTTFSHSSIIDSIGTKAQVAAMAQVMTGSFDLQLPSCGTGWTTIKPLATSYPNFVPLWQNHYGASGEEHPSVITQIRGGGYLIGGSTTSAAGNDISGTARGGSDVWIAKINGDGTKEWDLRFGGSNDDFLNSAIQTSDGGFLLGAYSSSGISGDKTGSCRGSDDYWAIKLDPLGNKLWDMTYGGSGSDQLRTVTETSTGQYLLGGNSSSQPGGEKTDSVIGTGPNYWLVKVNATTGAKIWDRRYGGNSDDFRAVRETKDKNYLLAGSTNGTRGGRSYMSQTTQGGFDYWILKVNTNGDTLWNRRFGGSLDDNLTAMEPVQALGDSSFILAGYSASPTSTDKSYVGYGQTDYWVLKVNSAGTKVWDKDYGGSSYETPSGIKEKDKGFFFGGYSQSAISTGNKTDTLYGSGSNYWLVRTDSAGTKLWDKDYGSIGGDLCQSVGIDYVGDYWISGQSTGGVSGNKKVGDYGMDDFWVIRGRDKCTHDSICFRWKTTPSIPDSLTTHYNPISCDSASCAIIYNSILTQVGQYIQTQLDSFKANYMNTCAIAGSIKDTCSLSYPLGYFHYTLYYYDRAGNLVRTVPPKGIVYYSGSRTSGTTADSLKTLYKYNSVKQLVQQQTPDGGITNFWYDSKGELRISQNAKQKLAGTYSYTKYDNLGRILEVGESSLAGYTTQSNLDNATFPTTNNAQRTYTVYSTPALNVYYLNTQPQAYLQNRVSYTYTDDGAYTYYSYDPHGNVSWLIQSLPGLGRSYIRYEYDLISNKVLKVHYNEGGVDEFHHRYSYDADQRILLAETSRDQHIWDKDAKYSYFRHGPLRREEIGTDRIQGIDYTYTITGWIKGINYVTTKNSDDPGADGVSNGFARDVFGMVLGYDSLDFNRTGSLFNPSNGNLMSSQRSGLSNLYNGNISSWTMKKDSVDGSNYTEQRGFRYRYDQLNRIRKEDYSRYTGTWQTTSDYDSHYSYDENGNLDTLVRNGYAAAFLAMDQFKYSYNAGNTLNHVSDAVASTNYTTDIDNQSANNYLYDAIGNLTKDVAGNINNISWTVYGKVKSVTKTNGDSIKFVYDASGNRVMKLFKPNGSTADTISYYVRDAQGNVMSIYSRKVGSTTYTYNQLEIPIYGSKRIGEFKPNIAVRSSLISGGCPTCLCCATGGSGMLWTINAAVQNGYNWRRIGKKVYELSDHLGNVHALVSDRKRKTNTDSTLFYMNYYAFGMEMPGKSYSGPNYRYGFNGKEKDNETYNSDGASYDFGSRIFDPRLGKFLSVDPLFKNFVQYSPYSFAANSPIRLVDIDGMAPGDPVGPGYYTAHETTREAGFFLRHPVYATQIGIVTHNSNNISTNAARFAVNAQLPEDLATFEGSHTNALRHAIWQATITSSFGEDIAKEVGNAHEANPYTDLKQRSFKNLDDADQTIDLLNNQLGRAIGKANPKASMEEIASKTLDYFKENGLYTANKNKDGSYTIAQTKLTDKQYSSAKSALKNTDKDGFTPTQKQQVLEEAGTMLMMVK